MWKSSSKKFSQKLRDTSTSASGSSHKKCLSRRSDLETMSLFWSGSAITFPSSLCSDGVNAKVLTQQRVILPACRMKQAVPKSHRGITWFLVLKKLWNFFNVKLCHRIWWESLLKYVQTVSFRIFFSFSYIHWNFTCRSCIRALLTVKYLIWSILKWDPNYKWIR